MAIAQSKLPVSEAVSEAGSVFFMVFIHHLKFLTKYSPVEQLF
jgi:hypothetical protein